MAVKRSLEELEDKDSVLVSKKTRNKNSESGNSSDSMTSTSSASDDLEALDESQDSDDADEDESTSSDSTATGLGEESSADDGKLSIPQVPLPTKHLISSSPSSNLRSRVSSFLPVLQAANAKLDEDRATGKLEERLIDDADGDGQYIEMVCSPYCYSDLSPDGGVESWARRIGGDGRYE